MCLFFPDAETKSQMLSNMYYISYTIPTGEIPFSVFLSELGETGCSLVWGWEFCMKRPCTAGHLALLAHGHKVSSQTALSQTRPRQKYPSQMKTTALVESLSIRRLKRGGTSFKSLPTFKPLRNPKKVPCILR